MARKSTLSAAEQLELDEVNRRETRNTGFSLMNVRDKGYHEWGSYGKRIAIEWHTNRKMKDYEVRTIIPDGHVVLHIGKEKALIKAEDLNKWLRWA
tara:strand:+ start:113 stop:400 length:288 start_codon:yes stop_codon:yes gene_type:complete